ncbi:GNAT family N-acetyltransferase [Methanolobus sediminis]|uniref:GNAT family N-acetyltransferase n=1 Tax=Methanolobus sediminis TaxID=3072978 RepID=A0AA51YMN1_9EURY|nr:GNAT family N-acetyltransferase [Methanolobus sediminis]WMW26082.1 GNAT family N-acetyltransferase [Methanolobus sediminis]
MKIVSFSSEYSSAARSFVIDVLSGEGFDYDPLKDSDLDDIPGNYSVKGGAFFLCLVNGDIVGTSAVKYLNPDVCEIKRLYVKKDYRGRRIGFALFQKALEYAEDNFTRAKLKTDSTLKTAISIYVKNGFSVVKEESGTVYFEKYLQSGKSE